MDAKADGRLREAAQEQAPQDGCGGVPVSAGDFYRWAEQWPEVCPRLAERDEDVLLAVGDLHVENFGVWPDSRKGWSGGSTTSTKPANCRSRAISCGLRPVPSRRGGGAETCQANQVCDPLLAGYRAGLRNGGEPILLTERHPALVTLTRDTQEDPKTFWKKKLDPENNPAIDAPSFLAGSRTCSAPRFDPAQPGVPRAAVARWARQPGPAALHRRGEAEEGVHDAREAKALVPSALYWWAGTERHALADGHTAATCGPRSRPVLPGA